MEQRKKLIGKKIKEIRKRENLTQELFSEKIGIEPSSLSNIENGKSFPSMVTVINITDKFNVSFNDFFDTEYLINENDLEQEIINIIKKQSYKNKQLIFKIIKQFL